jgi:RNA recognition motif-containing protein
MNIYVGNLSYGVSDDNLREVFEAFGAVSSAKVITDKYSGRSKGFGFVEMDNDAEANAAIEQLDGAEIDGRAVKVNEARPKEDNRGGGGYRGGGNRGGGGGGYRR